jgi:hypothetical protein
MHDIEPFYQWNHLYSSEEDEESPFFNTEHSEFYFTNAVYNYMIHPQWDSFGSPTLYVKMLYVDYPSGYAILEFIGEWNDCINNDIMTLKRELIDVLIDKGVIKFLLLGEHIMNFHSSDDSYYEEWFEDIEEGWIALVNFRQHVLEEFKQARIDYYLLFGGELDDIPWRKYQPLKLLEKIDFIVSRRLT